MNDQNRNLIYNVAVYYLDNQFYIIPLVCMPPMGLRTQVLPLYIAPVESIEKFADAIEFARSQSDVTSYSEKVVSQREKWDGNKERIWNTAKKTWDIIWRDDGSVSINPAEPYTRHRNGVEWKFIKDAKKILPPPISARDIAEGILNQI